MSHFTVLVVGPDISAALAPFGETAKERIYPPKESEEQLREEYEKRTDKTESFETWMREWHGYYLNAETGKYMTAHNPRAKWDWYRPGGRWSNQLITKGGIACDSARVGDLDFEAMRVTAIAEAERWWAEAMRESPEGRQFRFGITPETTKEQYIAKAARFGTFAVLKGGEWFEKGRMGWWACVSDEKPEAEWEAQFEALLRSLGPDEVITVVDCHI